MFCRRRKRPRWAMQPLRVIIGPGEDAMEGAPRHIDVYSVECEACLRRKLGADAHIAVVGPTSHVDRRRAKRLSTAPDVVILVGDWPTTDQPPASQPPQSAGLVVRLALHALPGYAREEYRQEALAILEDGCLDRGASRLRRIGWIVRNVTDLLFTGLRLRLRAKPLWCMPIWHRPNPDRQEVQRVMHRLEKLLK